MYYVYIIKSVENKKVYIGMSKDLKNRIKEHNNKKSKHTKSDAPWKLIWYCVFKDKDKSSNFEKYLKSGSGFAFRNKRLI